MNISTPYVKVDLDKVENNIKRMVKGLSDAGVAHRPHIKPHKCIEIAKKQIALGAKGITTAKISEAEVMVKGGITDVLIAFPILGENALQRLKKLCQKADVKTTVDSMTLAEGISKIGEELNTKIKVLIEIDGGLHRGGLQPGQATLDFAKEISVLPGIELVGIFGYMGQIYGEGNRENIKVAAKREADMLIETKKLLNDNGINVEITSAGSTPSSTFPEQLTGITESRAGNYVYYDMNAVVLGIAKEEDCALKVRSRVVSTPLPGYASIDAGSKTLTTDGSLAGANYGYICGKPGVEIVKLNEEHGFLRFDPEKYDLKVGDEVEVIPNHSCVISNLSEVVYGFRNGKFEKELTVDARGKNY